MTDTSAGYRAIAGDVYHTHPNCPVGRRIPAEWRRDGSAGLPLCPACRARAEAIVRPAPPPPSEPAADSRTFRPSSGMS
jgi:hypothetical protein